MANYLKRVLNQMYEPLINQDVLEKLCEECQNDRENDEIVDHIRSTVNELDDEMHKNTLKHLVQFMQEVSALEKYNRMTPYNLAVCVCPNFSRFDQQGLTSTFY